MATYKIIHKEKLIGWYYVEAENWEQALDVFNHQVCNGEIDFSDMDLVESSDDAVLEEE